MGHTLARTAYLILVLHTALALCTVYRMDLVAHSALRTPPHSARSPVHTTPRIGARVPLCTFAFLHYTLLSRRFRGTPHSCSRFCWMGPSCHGPIYCTSVTSHHTGMHLDLSLTHAPLRTVFWEVSHTTLCTLGLHSLHLPAATTHSASFSFPSPHWTTFGHVTPLPHCLHTFARSFSAPATRTPHTCTLLGLLPHTALTRLRSEDTTAGSWFIHGTRDHTGPHTCTAHPGLSPLLHWPLFLHYVDFTYAHRCTTALGSTDLPHLLCVLVHAEFCVHSPRRGVVTCSPAPHTWDLGMRLWFGYSRGFARITAVEFCITVGPLLVFLSAPGYICTLGFCTALHWICTVHATLTLCGSVHTPTPLHVLPAPGPATLHCEYHWDWDGLLRDTTSAFLRFYCTPLGWMLPVLTVLSASPPGISLPLDPLAPRTGGPLLHFSHHLCPRNRFFTCILPLHTPTPLSSAYLFFSAGRFLPCRSASFLPPLCTTCHLYCTFSHSRFTWILS